MDIFNSFVSGRPLSPGGRPALKDYCDWCLREYVRAPDREGFLLQSADSLVEIATEIKIDVKGPSKCTGLAGQLYQHGLTLARAVEEWRFSLTDARAGAAANLEKRWHGMLDGLIQFDGACGWANFHAFISGPSGQQQAPVAKADVLVVTVNVNETTALLKAAESRLGQAAAALAIDRRLYRELGTINGVRVMHTITEMGSAGPGATQQAVLSSILALRPDAIVAVGIAYGIDERKQAIGDILISKQVSLFDIQRRGSKTVQRGDRAHASGWLIQFFETFAQVGWKRSKVFGGVVLSGDKLVDDLPFRDELTAIEPEAIGGEMEGAGLYVAASAEKSDWIVLKAICDWGDGLKGVDKQARQELAAANAAEFFFEALEHAPLRPN